MRENIPDEGISLRDCFEIIRRRKWIIITCLVIVVTVVAFSTFRQTPIYKATVTVLIGKESPEILSFKDVVDLGAEGDYRNYYETQLKIIKSRSIARKAAEKLSADKSMFTKIVSPSGLLSPVKKWIKQFPKKEEDISPKPIDLTGKVLNAIVVETVRNSRLVKISAEHPSPEQAAKIADTVAEVYVEENLTRKIKVSEGAVDWIKEELDGLKKKLEDSEKALQDYKKQTDIVSLEKSQDIIVRRLTELNSAFTKAQIERVRAEETYQKLKEVSQEGSALESISLMRDDSLIQSLKSQNVNLRNEYNKLLGTYKSEHPEMLRLKLQMEQVEKTITTEIQKIVKSLKIEYEVAKSREESLRKVLDEQRKRVQQLNDKTIQYRILFREAKMNRKMHDTLLERMKEVKISSTTKENNIVILDRAEIPKSPVKPKKKRNIFLSVVVGLVMGTGLAFFVDYLDNAVRSVEDIEAEIKLPVIASIPNIKAENEVERDKIALKGTMPNLSEAYRTLRTNLRFLSPDQILKNILITSSAPQEGKTMTLTNLGITLSQTGNKVLLVDADLRRFNLHRAFNLRRAPGLTEFLTGKSEIEPLIQKTEVDNLSMVCGGEKLPFNPSELLDSERMKTFVEHVKSKHDIVLYDSPPIVGMSDAVILAGLMDGVLQVVRSGKTPKGLVLRGKEILTNAEIKVIGIVLNGVDIHSGNYYHYYHYYHNYHGEKSL